MMQLTEWTLKSNDFLPQDNLRQERGTYMVACFAPNYANLFWELWDGLYIFSKNNPFIENGDLVIFCVTKGQGTCDTKIYISF